MKAGQVLSTVEFPGLDEDQAAYLQGRLASLRDNVPAVEWKQMRRLLADEWGSDPEAELESIEHEAAAAASIGQVYRGRLRDGREVAIKVQYPGIGDAVASDMRNLRMLSPLLRRLAPGLDVKDVLDELAERVIEECDYELEAANHRRIERYWRRHPFVRVPAVETSLSRRRVLVTEWVDGLDFERVAEEPDEVRDRYAETIYRFYYATASGLGVALGDPHPGNYLLTDDGRVAFFDFGMLRELPADYLRREGEIFRAIRSGDASALTSDLRVLGYLPGPSVEWDSELLLEHMRMLSWWFLGDEKMRLEPEDLWRNADMMRDGSGSEMIEQMRRMSLPTEALLLRRMEGLLFQIASTVRAAAPWGPLLDELLAGGEPAGELGAAHAAWLAER